MRAITIMAALLAVTVSSCSDEPADADADVDNSDAGGDSGGGDADSDSDADEDIGPGDAGGDADADDAGSDADPYDGGTGDPLGTCTDPDPPFSDDEQTLHDLPAGSWWQAPASTMRTVCPDRGDENCAAVITAWSGGAYDTVHNRVLIFGGGHADYSGNELYAFDIGTLTWSRLTDPSPSTYMDQDPLPDGQPVSRHSYDGLQYLTHADRFFAVGGSRWHDGGGTHVTWTFDPGANTWQDMEPENVPSFSNCCSDASAYDFASRRVYLHITGYLVSYDFDTNRYETLSDFGFPPLWPRYEVWGDKRCLMDTSRDLLWCLGSGLVMVYDVANDQYVTDDWVTTGGAPFSNADQVGGHTEQIFETTGGEVITASAPGADYDAVSDEIVAWVGGGVWALDLETREWRHGTSEGAPESPTSHGTYGRWRYIPRTNVFVLVNSVDDNVYFYKHTPGCGI